MEYVSADSEVVRRPFEKYSKKKRFLMDNRGSIIPSFRSDRNLRKQVDLGTFRSVNYSDSDIRAPDIMEWIILCLHPYTLSRHQSSSRWG